MLLAARPPDLGDRLDIVRGALDARLHPQVQEPPRPEPAANPLRLSSLAAIAGGILWMVGGVAFVATPIDVDLGYKNSNVPYLITVVAALLTGQLAISVTRRLRAELRALRIPTGAIVLGTFGLLLPWPILALGFYSLMLGTMGFALLLNARLGRAAVVLGAAAFASLLFNTETISALILVGMGTAWILVAWIVWLRGLAGHARDRSVAG
jgi:hypothetical protein